MRPTGSPAADRQGVGQSMNEETETKLMRGLKRIDKLEFGSLYAMIILIAGDGLGIWSIQGHARAAVAVIMILSLVAVSARSLFRQRAKRRAVEADRRVRVVERSIKQNHGGEPD